MAKTAARELDAALDALQNEARAAGLTEAEVMAELVAYNAERRAAEAAASAGLPADQAGGGFARRS